MSSYQFGKTVNRPFDETLRQVVSALKAEGFGVLTDIDVAATMKQKLGIELKPYRILGACNPPLAHQALEAEPAIGVLLPCNVVVRVQDDDTVRVEVMDPQAVLGLVGDPAIEPLAAEVRARLERMLEAIAR